MIYSNGLNTHALIISNSLACTHQQKQSTPFLHIEVAYNSFTRPIPATQTWMKIKGSSTFHEDCRRVKR